MFPQLLTGFYSKMFFDKLNPLVNDIFHNARDLSIITELSEYLQDATF